MNQEFFNNFYNKLRDENLEKIFNNHNSHISNYFLKIILSSDITIFEKLINDLILELKFHDVNLKLKDFICNFDKSYFNFIIM